MNSILKVKDLSVKYGRHEALSDVSFGVEKGDYIGIVGPNGSGKTTLTKAILGLLPVNSGSIELMEGRTTGNSVGYLPQRAITNDRIFPGKVSEIVATGITTCQKGFMFSNIKCRKAVKDILQSLKIENLADKRIGSLSGGQQQRVLLARAMVSSPEILILDEPTSALDPQIREDFYSTLKELNDKKGTTILLVTHDVSTIGKYTGKILYLDRSLIFFGDYDEYIKMEDKIHG
jgi:zinc transport system ATP-binding protein